MKHRKIQLWLLLIILTSASGIVHAQTKFGIKAGVSFSNVTDKAEDGNKSGIQNTPGFLIGFTADVHLAGDFYSQHCSMSVKDSNRKAAAFTALQPIFRSRLTI